MTKTGLACCAALFISGFCLLQFLNFWSLAAFGCAIVGCIAAVMPSEKQDEEWTISPPHRDEFREKDD